MSTIRWIEDLEAASQLAKDYEKLMLIEFYSDQCYWCDQLDRNTFTDTEIIQLTSEFVCLKLNSSTDENALTLAKKYDISGYPTTIFAESGAEEIDRIFGYRDPQAFRPVMEELLRNQKQIEELKHRISQYPDESESNFQLAMLYLKRKKIDNAAPLIQKLSDANLSETDQAQLLMAYGIALAVAKRYSEALESFEQVIRVLPKNELLGQKQYYLGITHGTLGDFDQCQAMLKVCAETDTEDSKWHQQEAQRILECIGLPIPRNFSAPPVRVTPPSPVSNTEQIAFVSNRTGHDEIYVMNPDGSEQKQLTHRKSLARSPAWSPNRDQIAFVSGGRLYVINADGRGEMNLSEGLPRGEVIGSISWSPDGNWIAFAITFGRASYGENLLSGIRDICVMNVEDKSFFNLTRNILNQNIQKWSSGPQWSPDGTLILYNTSCDGQSNIYIMNSDGSDQRQLTHSGCDGAASFSPDGRKITFESSRNGRKGYDDIYLMDTNGQNIRQLTYSGFRIPRWSPDGQQLTFYKLMSHDSDGIYVMSLHTDRIERLISQGNSPAWS